MISPVKNYSSKLGCIKKLETEIMRHLGTMSSKKQFEGISHILPEEESSEG